MAKLRADLLRHELAATQAEAKLSEIEARDLVGHLEEQVKYHRDCSDWYRGMVPRAKLRLGEGRSPSPVGDRDHPTPPANSSNFNAGAPAFVPPGAGVGPIGDDDGGTNPRTSGGDWGEDDECWEEEEEEEEDTAQPGDDVRGQASSDPAPAMPTTSASATSAPPRAGTRRTSGSPRRRRGRSPEADFFTGAMKALQATQTTHSREADTIKVGVFPTVTSLDTWKSNSVRELAVASGRSDTAASNWLRPILNGKGQALSDLDLTVVPPEFHSLDARLSKALEAMCKKHGEQKKGSFYNSLQHEMRQYHEAHDMFMPDKMMLRKVLQSVQVENFDTDTWTQALLKKMHNPAMITDTMRFEVMRQCFVQSKLLRGGLEYWDRLPESNEQKTFRWIFSRVQYYIDKARAEKSTQRLSTPLRPHRPGAALTTPPRPLEMRIPRGRRRARVRRRMTSPRGVRNPKPTTRHPEEKMARRGNRQGDRQRQGFGRTVREGRVLPLCPARLVRARRLHVRASQGPP